MIRFGTHACQIRLLGKGVFLLYFAVKTTSIIASGNDNGNEIGNDKIDKDTMLVLEILRQEPSITAKVMSEKTDISTRKIGRIMKQLREDGIITRVGSDRKGYWEFIQQ